MFDFIYWPISAVLWFWHKIFSVPFGPDSGLSWVLSIIFLTFTLRLLLLKPAVSQMRSMQKMQKMQPKMKAIREKYKNDKQRQMEETRKLQKEMGVNPLVGCIVPLAQIPVFFGLFHVLRSFNRTGTGTGELGLSPEENYNTANYIFNVEDVQSFLDANVFGVPLSAAIRLPESMYSAFPNITDLTRTKVILVAAPLILIIALATHMNARMSVRRQEERRASGKQSAPDNELMANQMGMMNNLMMWVMPFTILITGVFWHIGLLFYMMGNNIWTYCQQRWLYGKMDREEEAEEEAEKALKRSTAPKPGQKPNNPKKRKK